MYLSTLEDGEEGKLTRTELDGNSPGSGERDIRYGVIDKM